MGCCASSASDYDRAQAYPPKRPTDRASTERPGESMPLRSSHYTEPQETHQRRNSWQASSRAVPPAAVPTARAPTAALVAPAPITVAARDTAPFARDTGADLTSSAGQPDELQTWEEQFEKRSVLESALAHALATPRHALSNNWVQVGVGEYVHLITGQRANESELLQAVRSIETSIQVGVDASGVRRVVPDDLNKVHLGTIFAKVEEFAMALMLKLDADVSLLAPRSRFKRDVAVLVSAVCLRVLLQAAADFLQAVPQSAASTPGGAVDAAAAKKIYKKLTKTLPKEVRSIVCTDNALSELLESLCSPTLTLLELCNRGGYTFSMDTVGMRMPVTKDDPYLPVLEGFDVPLPRGFVVILFTGVQHKGMRVCAPLVAR